MPLAGWGKGLGGQARPLLLGVLVLLGVASGEAWAGWVLLLLVVVAAAATAAVPAASAGVAASCRLLLMVLLVVVLLVVLVAAVLDATQSAARGAPAAAAAAAAAPLLPSGGRKLPSRETTDCASARFMFLMVSVCSCWALVKGRRPQITASF